MKTHKFFDKHTILGCLTILVLFTILVFSLVNQLSTGLLLLLSCNASLSAMMGTVLGALAILAVFHFWFRKEFDGFFGCRRSGLSFAGSFQLGLKEGCIIFAYWLLLILLGFVFGKMGLPVWASFAEAVMAGVGEEALFRSTFLSYLMRQVKSNKGLVVSLSLTSILFGLAHLSNLRMGAGLSITILQVIAASCMGFVFGYVFLRTGNIFVCMLLHAGTDLVCFFDQSQASAQGLMIAQQLSLANYIDLGFTLLMLTYVLYKLSRPGHLEEIRTFWAAKWNAMN